MSDARVDGDGGSAAAGGEAAKATPEWRVALIGRTDTTVYVEVQDGLGGVWSGRLSEMEGAEQERPAAER